MNNLAHIIINLTALQRQWIYLEPVFARNALPSEKMRFKRVDESFCTFSARIAVDPLVVSLLDIQQLRDSSYLQRLIAQLDICQRALSDFLQDKKSSNSIVYQSHETSLVCDEEDQESSSTSR